MAVQEATEAQKALAKLSAKDSKEALEQQAKQLAAEQLAKAKKALDDATQMLAQLPEQAIGNLNKAISKLLYIIDGYVSTDSDQFSAEKIIQQIEELLKPVLKTLSSLPVPEIPGLKQIKSILAALKALLTSTSTGNSGNLKMPKAEIPPGLMTMIRDLLRAIQSLCMTLPLVFVNLIFKILNCIIKLFEQISNAIGVPPIPYPLNIVPKCVEAMPDIMSFMLQMPGKMFDVMNGTLKRVFGKINELQFPAMPDKIEMPKLSVPSPVNDIASAASSSIQPIEEATTTKWNSALLEAGIDVNKNTSD